MNSSEMANSTANQLALVVSSNNTTSYEGLLESQKELITKQIYELQNILSKQCKLTGVNPLSQEMAAGALSIKIGKRPRDLLNPKAIKYMQSIFSVKDEINKKEMRAISALFGLTATQVRDFFTGQRTRVRRFIRLSREKAIQSAEGVQEQVGSLSSNTDTPNHPVTLNFMGPCTIEAPSCFMQDEVLPDTSDSDKYFIANIFNLLRKEETFSGQVKLMEWILQIQNASVLFWFLTNGGVMILALWLSQAAIEEQTTVLHFILRVLCLLPLHKALPVHMSAILQSVNKLRFYRGSDISNRAKSLLSRWSKMFARSQAMRKPNANLSLVDAQNELLLKQSIGEIVENESLESKIDNPAAIYSLQENSENSRSQSIKLLTGTSDYSNMKLLKGVSSSHNRERRKVQLVEQPGQKAASRGPQVTRVFSTTQGRPLSADDIQKAKIRAQFMRNKYGEGYINPQVKTEVPRVSSTSEAKMAISPSKPHIRPKVEEHATTSSSMTHLPVSPVRPNDEEHRMLVKSGDEMAVTVTVHGKVVMDSEELVWKKCKRMQISWVNPLEMKINKEWSVCCGENNKEVDVQTNRIKREKEVFYITILEIPQNPKEPWDLEMDYDDSLTPEIPIEQLPDDDDNMVVAPPTQVTPDPINIYAANISTVTEYNNRNMPEPDLELLAVLLKNPQIVFALTAGQDRSLTNEQMVKLLDAIKENAASGGSINCLVNGLVERKTEETVDVSLPSPTPSSNPGTSGWQPESSKNQFSRQSVAVNDDAYAIPGVYFQETTEQAIAPVTHQRLSDVVLDRRNISNLITDRRNIPAGINGQPFQGVTTHQRISDMVPDQRYLQEANACSDAYFLPGYGGSQLAPYSPSDHTTNYNVYGTTREFAQPVRSHEYNGWDYSDPNDHRSNNYRQEMSRMQHDPTPPRYGDCGGRNDISRWWDRRR